MYGALGASGPEHICGQNNVTHELLISGPHDLSKLLPTVIHQDPAHTQIRAGHGTTSLKAMFEAKYTRHFGRHIGYITTDYLLELSVIGNSNYRP